MAIQKLRRRVDDIVGAKQDRALKRRREKCVVDRNAHPRPLCLRREPRNVDDAQQRVAGRLDQHQRRVGVQRSRDGGAVALIDESERKLAELRAGFSPKRGPFSFLQGYGFFDVGKIWNLKRTGGDADLASAGVGVRARVGDRATLTAEAARPLTRTPYDRRKKSWRPFFSLSTRF